ncbi:MAG: hypothetical protein JWN78_413 [Bacteroidota bacterium]|nr:hypothetical protein [Bacteroidota bacterium]
MDKKPKLFFVITTKVIIYLLTLGVILFGIHVMLKNYNFKIIDNNTIVVLTLMIINILPFFMFNYIVLKNLKTKKNNTRFWIISGLLFFVCISSIPLGYTFYITFIFYGGFASVSYIKIIRNSFFNKMVFIKIHLLLIFFLYAIIDVILLLVHKRIANYYNLDDLKFLIISRLIIWQLFTAMMLDLIFIHKQIWFTKAEYD